jgi:signal transduction histidine kinase
MFSRYRLTPALQWHLELLCRLLGEFYVAKLREEKLRETSYLQAVHETGARTTHDIKNLLQSLNVLVSVATDSDVHDAARLNALVRRQLPAVAQRLAETLDRLQRPQPEGESYVAAAAWWDGIARQYANEGVEFLPAGVAGTARLPRSLFDSVADNLIRNALAKRTEDPSVRVRVSLEGSTELLLRVRDSGAAVPEDLAAGLLRAPVFSSAGLGIGLYQAARQSAASGYRLALETNRDGDVCFLLAGPAF